MEDQIYQRAKQLLFEQTQFYHQNPSTLNQLVSPQLRQFFKIILKRYVDAQDVFNLIKNDFTVGASKSFGNISTLPQRLREVTGDSRCSDNFAYFLNCEKQNISYRYVLDNINSRLRQLKYFEFPLIQGKYQYSFDEKIKKIVDAVNIYESFVIGLAAVKAPSQLQGKQRAVFSCYASRYQTIPNMVQPLRSIEQSKEELISLKQEIMKLGIEQDKDDIYTLKSIVARSLETRTQLEDATKQLNQFYSLFEKMTSCVKDRKDIPSYISTLPCLTYWKHKQVIEDYGQFCRQISILTKTSPSSTTSSPSVQKVFGVPYSTSQNANYYTSISLIELYHFIDKIYLRVDPTKSIHLTRQKMEWIEKVIDSQETYSSSIVEQLKSYTQILNRLIDNCLRYFQLPKASEHSSLSFTFSPKQLQHLDSIVLQQLNSAEQHLIQRQEEQLKEELERLRREVHNLQREKEDYAEFEKQISLALFNQGAKNELKENDLRSLIFVKIKELNQRVKQSQEKIPENPIKTEEFEILAEEPEKLQNIEPCLQKKLDKFSQLLHEKIKEIESIQSNNRVLIQEKADLETTIKNRQFSLELKEKQLMTKQQQIAALILSASKTPEQKFAADLHKIKEQSQRQIQNRSFEYSELKEENHQMHNQKIELKNKLQEKQRENIQNIKKYELEMENLKKETAQLKIQNDILLNQINKIEQDEGMLKEQNSRWKIEHEQINKKYMQKITQDLDRTFTQIQKVSPLMESQELYKDFIDQIEEKKASPLTFTQEISKEKEDENKTIQKLKQEFSRQYGEVIDTLKSAEKRLQMELEFIKDELKEKDDILRSIDQQKKLLEDDNNEKQTKIKSFGDKIREQEKAIRELEFTVNDLKEKEKRRIENQMKLNKQTSSTRVVPSGLPTLISYTSALFNDEIFRHDDHLKDRLVDHLQTYVQSRIVRTDLLYKFDPRNKNNFHLYLDNHKSLALVIKTPFTLLAAYYPGIYRQKQIMDLGGVLVSVSNDKSYLLNQKKPQGKILFRGMIYDSYYMIFGNAQIRIKQGLNTIFSNFGVNNSFFNHQGHKINSLFNEGDKRQVEFEHYQFYEVTFEREL